MVIKIEWMDWGYLEHKPQGKGPRDHPSCNGKSRCIRDGTNNNQTVGNGGREIIEG